MNNNGQNGLDNQENQAGSDKPEQKRFNGGQGDSGIQSGNPLNLDEFKQNTRSTKSLRTGNEDFQVTLPTEAQNLEKGTKAGAVLEGSASAAPNKETLLRAPEKPVVVEDKGRTSRSSDAPSTTSRSPQDVRTPQDTNPQVIANKQAGEVPIKGSPVGPVPSADGAILLAKNAETEHKEPAPVVKTSGEPAIVNKGIVAPAQDVQSGPIAQNKGVQPNVSAVQTAAKEGVAPKIEAPTPKIETPTPKIETPAPKIESPAGVSNADHGRAAPLASIPVSGQSKSDGSTVPEQKQATQVIKSGSGDLSVSAQPVPSKDALSPGKDVSLQGKSDYINTQGLPGSNQSVQGGANRTDSVRTSDVKGEPGKGSEPVPMKDTKVSSGLVDDLGHKAESGSRVEPSAMQQSGIKQDSGVSTQKADQIIKGIEARVNEGVKPPTSQDGHGPSSSEAATAGGKQTHTTDSGASSNHQPAIEGGGKGQSTVDGASGKHTGTADSANVGGKQPSSGDTSNVGGKQANASDAASSGGKQTTHDAGDKGSGGGGSTITGESTKRIDAGMSGGGKAEGQSGSGGMGGGSSAPVDRAPHSPFNVEDGHSTKGAIGEGKGEAATSKGDSVVGKGDSAAGRGDAATGGKGGAGTGPRFDTGEVRGNEPGARFDTPELRGGKSGGQSTGSGGDVGGVKGTDLGTGKGVDGVGSKGGSGGGSGFGGSGEASILGDKRQPPVIPDGIINQTGKTGKVGDVVPGIVGAHGDDGIPFILPGALAGKEGGRRQNDQIFGGNTKAGEVPSGKSPSGKSDSIGPGVAGQKSDVGTAGVIPGQKADAGAAGNIAGQKGDTVVSAGSSALGQKPEDQSKDPRDKGQKSDVGIPISMPGQIVSGAADVGGVLRNFAQNVLSDGKSDGKSTGKAGEIIGDPKDVTKQTNANDVAGKNQPAGRQDFAGPGQKTRILDDQPALKTDTAGAKLPGDAKLSGDSKLSGDQIIAGKGVSSSSSSSSSDRKLSTAADGSSSGMLEGGESVEAGEEGIPVEDFQLPPIDLLGEAEEIAEVEEEVEKTVEASMEDAMHYELAMGLQLYTTVAEAQYGAYHYYTKEGDTVEIVARDIVGDVRCAPLVFSLNKEHIVASTEYGVHPFKVGVMIQLPTPRDLKEFFGSQS